MTRALDERKRREWVKRFERFRASGATVAHFCGHERVSVNSFYYWSKRVGSAASLEQRHAAGEALGRVVASDRAGARRDGDEPADAKDIAQALVRFRFGSVEVEVPAGCLDVIRCLVDSVGNPDTPAVRTMPAAFHEIVLGSRR